MARGFLDNSWHTLRSDKMLVNAGRNLGLEESLEFERQNSRSGDDMAERLAGFSKGG
jgi:hypothetical protein